MHIPVDGRRLWAEFSGPTKSDLVVLIADANEIAARWPDSLVAGLVDAGFRVARFDHRDCGRSDAVSEPYDLSAMASDVVAVVRAADADVAHLVGRSMGAMVAQVVALEWPDIVASLTLVSATPGLGDERLPTMDAELLSTHIERLLTGEPHDLDDRRAWRVEGYRNFAGNRYRFDEDRQSQLAAMELSDDHPTHTRHAEAIVASPSRLDHLDQIVAPTLVVHGRGDLVLPLPHAEALVAGIPKARLEVIDGLGHEFPEALVSDLVPLLLDHLHAALPAGEDER